MGKLTTEVFNESCCDGGECRPQDLSAQSCGCDKGANWVCAEHRQIISHCESCGPTLEEVRRHEGTDWCKACFDAEGWKW